MYSFYSKVPIDQYLNMFARCFLYSFIGFGSKICIGKILSEKFHFSPFPTSVTSIQTVSQICIFTRKIDGFIKQ